MASGRKGSRQAPVTPGRFKSQGRNRGRDRRAPEIDDYDIDQDDTYAPPPLAVDDEPEPPEVDDRVPAPMPQLQLAA